VIDDSSVGLCAAETESLTTDVNTSTHHKSQSHTNISLTLHPSITNTSLGSAELSCLYTEN